MEDSRLIYIYIDVTMYAYVVLLFYYYTFTTVWWIDVRRGTLCSRLRGGTEVYDRINGHNNTHIYILYTS